MPDDTSPQFRMTAMQKKVLDADKKGYCRGVEDAAVRVAAYAREFERDCEESRVLFEAERDIRALTAPASDKETDSDV